MEVIIGAVNIVIESVGGAIEWATGRLSWSPFSSVTTALNDSRSSFPDWVAMFNWVVPIAEMVVVLEAWGACIVVWYGLSILLRWLKAVE